MQYTGSLQTISRKSIQVAILGAVAVTGIAFGRWAIPAEHTSPAITITRFETTPSELARARAERKLIQMDQADDPHGAVAVAAAHSGDSLSPALRKLIQMDQADDRRAASAGAVSSSTPLSAAERKLIQMDQADDRRAALAAAAPNSGTSLSAAERKLIQMDARDAR